MALAMIPATAEEDITIAMIGQQLGNVVFLDAEKGMYAAGEDLGVKVEWQSPMQAVAEEQNDIMLNLISRGDVDGIAISCTTGEGIADLKKCIENLFAKGEIDYDTTAILANARQKGALDRAIEGVQAALEALESGFTPDVAGMDLEEAMAALSEADGRAVSADIVDAIFHRFCVGK
jgi:tRNA U34 5-carboxymethylaminomethyl modifying GTPase MnmE/TrmE